MGLVAAFMTMGSQTVDGVVARALGVKAGMTLAEVRTTAMIESALKQCLHMDLHLPKTP
jgi:hypothetical protein